MIKQLEKRFVMTTMLALVMLLTGLIATINTVNAITISSETDEVLEYISKGEYASNYMTTPPRVRLKARRAAYFIVYVNADEEIVACDTSRIADVTQQQAVSISESVVKLERLHGKTDNYKFKKATHTGNYISAYYFLDISEEQGSVKRVIALSIMICILCLIIMLVPVVFISKKAITPIAENIEKQKRFVTDAGHELKTPLAVILSNTEALELTVGESKYSKNIRTQVIRLNSLMQNLLTLSKSEEVINSCKKEQLDISELAKKTVGMFKESMELKKLTYQCEIDAEVKIEGNREMLTNLFSILADNAVQYSTEGSFIAVQLVKKGKGMEFHIANKCDKLPECDASKLFERFYREDKARTQKKGGSGIGLSAAKSIVTAHGGKIKAEYFPDDVIMFTVVI